MIVRKLPTSPYTNLHLHKPSYTSTNPPTPPYTYTDLPYTSLHLHKPSYTYTNLATPHYTYTNLPTPPTPHYTYINLPTPPYNQIVYATISLIRWKDAIHSLGGVAIGGVIISALAVAGGMGLCSVSGLKFNPSSTQVSKKLYLYSQSQVLYLLPKLKLFYI